nr:globin domain-containing protein [Deinobacterium chartae]
MIRHSLSRALQRRRLLGQRFYRQLFDRHPELRTLFSDDLAAQERKLEETLDVFAGDLSRWEALRPAMRRLGGRHVGYGVRPEHYTQVGEALLGALAEVLEESFTPEVRAAWERVYGLLTQEMLRGAAPDPGEA